MTVVYCEEEIRKEYQELTKELITKNITIATMESATSGQLASLITDTEGASKVFKGGIITYSNEAKVMHGVPKDIIDEYTVYSKETAISMASRAKNIYGADIGIGVTGTMGSVDPSNQGASIPGEVYFAICFDDIVKAYYVKISPKPTRFLYKMAVAKEVYDELTGILCNFHGNDI